MTPGVESDLPSLPRVALPFVATMVAGLAFLGIWSVVIASFRAVEDVRIDGHVAAVAEDLMERIHAMPFGHPGDPPLQEDAEPGAGTLHALAARASDLGGVVARWSDPAVSGAWALVVTPDIDGDGALGKGATPEDADRLMRVEVLHDDAVILRTVLCDAR